MTPYYEAIKRFKRIYARVQKMGLVEPTSMVLGTSDKNGRPSARVVLLKSVDEHGFTFYTNYASRKGQDIDGNPYAALVFYWDPLNYQIRVEGAVEKVSAAEADAYWKTRARDSQIGAWASQQSKYLESRAIFLKRIAQVALKYARQEIPRPPYWSGFRVVPNRIEFWTKKPFRLHERLVYEKIGAQWKTHLLYP